MSIASEDKTKALIQLNDNIMSMQSALNKVEIADLISREQYDMIDAKLMALISYIGMAFEPLLTLRLHKQISDAASQPAQQQLEPPL